MKSEQDRRSARTYRIEVFRDEQLIVCVDVIAKDEKEASAFVAIHSIPLGVPVRVVVTEVKRS